MTRFVTFKRGGQPGKVAVNADLVTDVRSTLGAFTDIFVGDRQIAVEGGFEQVIAMLTGQPESRPEQRSFIKPPEQVIGRIG